MLNFLKSVLSSIFSFLKKSYNYLVETGKKYFQTLSETPKASNVKTQNQVEIVEVEERSDKTAELKSHSLETTISTEQPILVDPATSETPKTLNVKTENQVEIVEVEERSDKTAELKSHSLETTISITDPNIVLRIATEQPILVDSATSKIPKASNVKTENQVEIVKVEERSDKTAELKSPSLETTISTEQPILVDPATSKTPKASNVKIENQVEIGEVEERSDKKSEKPLDILSEKSSNTDLKSSSLETTISTTNPVMLPRTSSEQLILVDPVSSERLNRTEEAQEARNMIWSSEQARMNKKDSIMRDIEEINRIHRINQANIAICVEYDSWHPQDLNIVFDKIAELIQQVISDYPGQTALVNKLLNDQEKFLQVKTDIENSVDANIINPEDGQELSSILKFSAIFFAFAMEKVLAEEPQIERSFAVRGRLTRRSNRTNYRL